MRPGPDIPPNAHCTIHWGLLAILRISHRFLLLLSLLSCLDILSQCSLKTFPFREFYFTFECQLLGQAFLNQEHLPPATAALSSHFPKLNLTMFLLCSSFLKYSKCLKLLLNRKHSTLQMNKRVYYKYKVIYCFSKPHEVLIFNTSTADLEKQRLSTCLTSRKWQRPCVV